MESDRAPSGVGDGASNQPASSTSDVNRKRPLDSAHDVNVQSAKRLPVENGENQAPVVSGSSASDTNLAREIQSARKQAEAIVLRNRLIDDLVAKYGECLPQEKWGVLVERINQDGKEIPVGMSVLIMMENQKNEEAFVVLAQAARLVDNEAQIAEGLYVFPPIRLLVRFLELESNEPTIELDCPWMGENQAAEIQRRFVGIFRQTYSGKSYILAITTAITWLRTTALSTVRMVEAQSITFLRREGAGSVDAPGRIHVRDPARALRLFQEINDETQAIRAAGLNPSAMFPCDICFGERQAYAAVIFPECNHFFCKQCVGDAFAVKVNEHTINNFTCLSCTSAAPPTMISTVLPKVVYDKYCAIKQDQETDRMQGVHKCPRCRTVTNYEQLARPKWKNMKCRGCTARFCLTCKKPAHQYRDCFTEEAVKDVQGKFLTASAEEIKELRKKYGAKNVKYAVVNVESEDWISKNVKTCPNPDCNASIQRFEGCNHVHCTRCLTHFCWLCRAVLEPTNPYSHFKADGCRTFDYPLPGDHPNRRPHVRLVPPAVARRQEAVRGVPQVPMNFAPPPPRPVVPQMSAYLPPRHAIIPLPHAPLANIANIAAGTANQGAAAANRPTVNRPASPNVQRNLADNF